MNLTGEQTCILDRVRTTDENLMINALAGCGKTSTLEMIDKIAKQKPAIYLVFNKRNAEEATERMLSTTTVRTFNGLGHRIWTSAIGKQPRLDNRKTYNIFKEIADEVPRSEAKIIWSAYDQVKQGIEIAKAIGYIPDGLPATGKKLANAVQLSNRLEEEPDDLVSTLLDAVLRRSIKQAYDGLIDFNDQVYMPALFGGTYPKFPLTLVDEYQDLNPVNHEMIRKLVGNRRLIGVGDPNQNIYGFRGAKSAGMAEAIKSHNMGEAMLSISFRCPSNIVRNTHWLVPHFRWSRDGGHVESLTVLDHTSIDPDAVFICRNNAPLLALAFRLLASGRSVSMAGSDIGPKLINILKKLGPSELSRSATISAIDDWEEAKLAKASSTAADMAECMRVLAKHGDSLGQAIAYTEHIFAQKGSIQLMTGHKSKGLEFPIVYHLDPHLIKDHQQDKHVRYVIQSRSSDRYFEIDSSAICWEV